MLDSGCCGLAGSFGFEREHDEISRQIGEQRLMPIVREAAEETILIADGFSCKTQIEELTERRALHTAQVIEMALEHRPAERRGARPERPTRTSSRTAPAGCAKPRWWAARSRSAQARWDRGPASAAALSPAAAAMKAPASRCGGG